MSCQVCKLTKNKPNYKCPKCRMPYCSVQCWKNHKGEECELPVEQAIADSENGVSSVKYLFPTEDTVEPEKLKLLGENEDLKTMLRNPHLRNIVSALDKSSNPSMAIKAVMLEPIFVEFAEKCLEIIDPDEERPKH